MTLKLLVHLTIGVLLFAAGGIAAAENVRIEALRDAASSLQASLTPDQLESLSYPLTDDARATWSNLPTLMAPPAGLFLKEMNDAQRSTVTELLRISLSSQGYAKSLGIMWLDDLLREIEGEQGQADPDFKNNALAVAMANNRDSGNYAVALFGNPSEISWGWKITGHHLAINITISGDRIGFLPTFLGSNPRVVSAGPYAGWMALPDEGALGLALMRLLSTEQRSAASLAATVPDDVFEGPGRRASLEKFEGVSASNLNRKQLAALQQLVMEYVRNANQEAAGAQLDAIGKAGWDKIWFSWRGALDADGQFYYRVHGPRILIEYNRQNPNHDHLVVRDPANDYGEDWLGHHYNEFHPSIDQIMKGLRGRLSAQPQSE